MRANGSYVGRAAPEIDVFEATIDGAVGKVSLSAQWAPYNVRHTDFLPYSSLRMCSTGELRLAEYN